MSSNVGQARELKDSPECWPSLPLESWESTRFTLHMWTQIVGKVRLALTPMVNHWWNVPLYVSPRGLTTSSMPYRDLIIEIEFDFISHQLHLRKSDGNSSSIALAPKTVADFYAEFLAMPVEIAHPIPFDEDRTHASYDRDAVHKFWRILASTSDVFHDFRALFIGKSSPVHFFWGSFDLALTRFSGRRAPAKPGADRITQEAYSHEVSSVGFWPGSGNVKEPSYYSYASPEPAGFSDYRVAPSAAAYRKDMGEFLLSYESVRTAPDPTAALFQFCQTTYEAAAINAKWNRDELERQQ